MNAQNLVWLLFLTNGRLNRRGFWLFFAPVFIAGSIKIGLTGEPFYVPLPGLILFGWCTIAVLVKRYHDRNKSGWWSALSLVPIIGLWIFIECGFFPGTNGENDYGNFKFLDHA